MISRRWLVVLALALGLGGCAGQGVSPEEKKVIVEKTGNTAYDVTYKETYDRLIKEGKSIDESEFLAKRAALLAKLAAEKVAQETIPERDPKADGFWGQLIFMVLNFGFAFAERKYA